MRTFLTELVLGALILLLSAGTCGAAEGAAKASAATELEIPLATILPVTKDGILRFGQRGRLDQMATVASEGDSGFLLVYGTFVGGDAELKDGRLRFARSLDGRSIGLPQPLAPVEAMLVGAPSLVVADSQPQLYFQSADHSNALPSIWRMSRVGEAWGRAVPLDPIPGLHRFIGWPRWRNVGEDVVLSFRDQQSMLNWSIGSVTNGFSDPIVVPNSKGAYVQVVAMTGGGWLASYQRRESDRHMVTWLRYSRDGKEWSEPAPLFWPSAPERPEVHDAFVLPRADAGADVYYIRAGNRGTKEAPRGAFDLYRRAVFGPDRLGPVQELTAPSGIEPLAPTAHRLPSGEVLVSFADILARKNGDTGWVAEAQLVLFRLPGDAPRD